MAQTPSSVRFIEEKSVPCTPEGGYATRNQTVQLKRSGAISIINHIYGCGALGLIADGYAPGYILSVNNNRA